MARPAGIEPATAGLEGRCSIRLSYGRLKKQKLRAPNVFPRPMLGSQANRIGSARGLYRTFPAFEAQSVFGRPSGRWHLFYVAGSTRTAYRSRLPRNIFLKLVGATGFEPATLWSQTRCATRLRHAPSPHRGRARGALMLPRFAGPGRSAVQRGAFCGDAIERGFKPRAARTAPAKSPAASKYSCRTERRPDRPRPSPCDCAGRARDSTP